MFIQFKNAVIMKQTGRAGPRATRADKVADSTQLVAHAYKSDFKNGE